MPKGGNWADEYIYEGYILYDQLLRVWALALLGEIYAKPEWYEKAISIEKTIKQAYKNDKKHHYNASFSPGSIFSQYDLAAHTIGGIVFSQNNEFFNNSLTWLFDTFLAENKLPTAFYPVIKEQDPEWEALSKYYLFRFKNMPHHFHNGGIWWIWLGWLSVTFSLWQKNKSLEKLSDLAFKYLEENKDKFQFHEYIASDTLEVDGTKNLVYTATGICFLSLAKNGFDFARLSPFEAQTIIEPHTIKEEYFDLSNELIEIITKAELFDKDKLVIGIAGESGSGKSVTAKCLQITLRKLNINSVVLHQDGYYKLPPKENHNKRKEDINWVGVHELKLELMQEHLNNFKAKMPVVDLSVVNYKSNKISTNGTFLKDKTVLIVEGVYTFFLENLDFKIFMSRTFKDTLEKRKSRNREEYDPFVEQVLEIEHNIVAKQKNMADVIINKGYSIEK